MVCQGANLEHESKKFEKNRGNASQLIVDHSFCRKLHSLKNAANFFDCKAKMPFPIHEADPFVWKLFHIAENDRCQNVSFILRLMDKLTSGETMHLMGTFLVQHQSLVCCLQAHNHTGILTQSGFCFNLVWTLGFQCFATDSNFELTKAFEPRLCKKPLLMMSLQVFVSLALIQLRTVMIMIPPKFHCTPAACWWGCMAFASATDDAWAPSWWACSKSKFVNDSASRVAKKPLPP